MMIESFKDKRPFIKIFRNRILIFLFAVASVVLLLWCTQILINKLSGPQKEVRAELLRREQALKEKIHCKILDTGYRKISVGGQELYAPLLVVEIANISPKIIQHLRLINYFKDGGKLLCSGEFEIDELNPQAKKTAVFLCSLKGGIDAIQWPQDLSRMRNPIVYELWLEAPGISMVIENGEVSSKPVLDPPPISHPS